MDPQVYTLKIYCIYTYTYVDAITINKIRGHEFEGEWGELREEWQRRTTTVKLQSQNIRGRSASSKSWGSGLHKKGEIESIIIYCSLLCLTHAAVFF